MNNFQPYDDHEYLWKNIHVHNRDDKIDEEIKQNYKNPGHPIAFSNAKTIYNFYNGDIPMKRIKEILKTLESYSIHKEFHKGKQNISFARFKRYQFQIDLCFLIDYAEWNDNVKYLLTVIDCFTRYAFVRSLTTKDSKTVLNAFKSIISELEEKPLTIVCDRGSEFVNAAFQTYCNDENMKLILPKSNLHAAYVERFNRTLQNLIFRYMTENSTNRYIDQLDNILQTYNSRYNRMINMSPIEAENNPNAELIINNMISKRDSLIKKEIPKFKIGDTVRISKQKDRFSRGYQPQSQVEIFKIYAISDNKKIPLYYLNDENNEKIEGGFYSYELTPVNLSIYRIERFIRRRKFRGQNQVLVKWVGYDDRFNRWIPEDDVNDIE
jgi:IS30 family transposase